jgi:hypothetical protein
MNRAYIPPREPSAELENVGFAFVLLWERRSRVALRRGQKAARRRSQIKEDYFLRTLAHKFVSFLELAVICLWIHQRIQLASFNFLMINPSELR